MGQSLITHKAGELILQKPNQLFRRETDRFIKKIINKQPLDVGADRIARTAHAALKLIDDLRERTGEVIPLAWDSNLDANISVIEVYPAATLAVAGLRSTGYKAKEKLDERREILCGLQRFAEINVSKSMIENDDDILDAIVCVIAGYDFITGLCVGPEKLDLAKKEGWIWVRSPDN